MATQATVQVPEDSVDQLGVSIVTATKTSADPRRGAIYHEDTLAAAVPVWFHRLNSTFTGQTESYLALFSTVWDDADPVYHPGAVVFSDHSELPGPAWATIDPTTGTVDGPFMLPGLDVLNAAVSRGDYLYTLGMQDGQAWVQAWRVSRSNSLLLEGEEAVPLGFNLGLFVDNGSPYLWVFGADGDGNLARIRKHWGRVGDNTDPQNQWEVDSGLGWVKDFDEGESLTGNIPADGPCTLARFNNRYWLVATRHSSGAYSAEVYTQRVVDTRWKRTGEPLALGADSIYMGGTAYLQPQLVANRSLLADGSTTGFPYVTSVERVVGDDHGILTDWGILSV